jgi:hypothetical protein
LDAALAVERLRGLEAAIAEADALEREIVAFEVELKSLSVDAKALKELQRLADAVTVTRAALEAVSVQLSFAPEGRKTITVAGGDAVLGMSVTVSERVTLALEGFGEVTVTPGAGELASRRNTLAKAEAALAEALAAHGVAALGDAQAAHDRRRDLTNRLGDKRAQLNRAPHSLDDMRRHAASLREETNRLSARDGEEMSDTERCRVRLTTAESEAGLAEKAFTAAEGAHATAMSEWQAVRDELGKLKLELAGERSKRATLEGELSARRAIHACRHFTKEARGHQKIRSTTPRDVAV